MAEVAEVAERFPSFRRKRQFRHPINLRIPIDFQGESILQTISTDFLRMSVNVSVERLWNAYSYLQLIDLKL